MQGCENIRFSELFADTIETHGIAWALQYYLGRGMSSREFRLWFRIWNGV